ncbi:phytanoyl-CoA dioxygenase family protein [Streptomyces sp. NPDC008092]|uniref:phytanoyl-CoA dioxygenase family protein n=1 Tax=Streptomyces sp. NPDC008092 TaxID=3364808 RepID=UPI0036EE4DC8
MAESTPDGYSIARAAYTERGWFVAAERLGPDVLDGIRRSVAEISAITRPEVVYEEGTRTVRALHGCHRYDRACAELVRHPMLLDLAEQLIGGPVYLYQFKVNIKSPREGREWPWHQDYAFWSHEDGMPTADAVNIAVNLDDVHETNGPLTVLTGSHVLGLVEDVEDVEDVGESGAGRDGGGRDWREHVSANLTHTVPESRVETLARDFHPKVLLGRAGTVTAFHPSIVHSSSNNLSADRRAMLVLTYNSVDNVPTKLSRPAFLVDRDATPVRRLK